MQKRKRITIFLTIGIVLLVLIGCRVFSIIRKYVAHRQYEIENRENSSYAEYLCRDYHLVCLDMDERVGNYVEGKYTFRYGTIEGISDQEYIYAYRLYLIYYGDNMILQHPENQTQVLDDWTINKVMLYYIDHNDQRNPRTYRMATAEDYVIHEMASSTEKELFAQLKEMKLCEEPTDAECFIGEKWLNYKRCINDSTTVCIRVYFDEAETLAWDAEIKIYQSTEDESKFAVTIDRGSINEEFERFYGEYVVDSNSILHQWIVDAWIQGEYDEK